MTLAALPSAPEAEAALLGTMLMFPNASRIAIEEGASAEDFYNERHRMIFNSNGNQFYGNSNNTMTDGRSIRCVLK